ncbi:hypothetical protein GR257_25005 [Rhizobium leguminosarum]|uniref:DNA-binding protein n=1 Tax=Rhizobium leguminosarum TaxID=384 RepID=A0A7K3VLN8_RHILE|nr:hypothetical protein [Rhizobium leguminosarum]
MTTTNEIADKIAADNGLTKAQGKSIVEAVLQAIADAAGSDTETSVPGFGKFKVKASPEREGRNPATGGRGFELTFAPRPEPDRPSTTRWQPPFKPSRRKSAKTTSRKPDMNGH